MKFDIDCVRNILLCIESNDFGNELLIDDLVARLPAYSHDELEYTCLKLLDGGFLDVTTAHCLGCSHPVVVRIHEITFSGHEFLDKIKSDTVWTKTKNIAGNIGSFSLNTIKEIATSVLSELIKSKF